MSYAVLSLVDWNAYHCTQIQGVISLFAKYLLEWKIMFLKQQEYNFEV